MNISQQSFNTEYGNVTWYTLTNKSGSKVVLSSLGAGIVSINILQKDGSFVDVVLGYDHPEDYMADGPCAGKTPGRFANRIAKGEFSLNGHKYNLPINNGPNHLHGGPDGFQNKIWRSDIVEDSSVVFTLESEDGDSGYPAKLVAKVQYIWDDNNTLIIKYTATSDAPTIVNLTNHTYFNLDGHSSGSVLAHSLQLNASRWLPTDSDLVPTGEIALVENTPMDFRQPTVIAEHITDDFPALTYGKGYDNCWLIDGQEGTIREAARLVAPKSGRSVVVSTDQPAVQVYTGNWLSGCPTGKDGYTYEDYDAVAIECQGCPDAPNHPGFPSALVTPEHPYSRTIQFHFE